MFVTSVARLVPGSNRELVSEGSHHAVGAGATGTPSSGLLSKENGGIRQSNV